MVIGSYLVLALTNDAHHLYFTEFIVTTTPFYHLDAVQGSAYFLPLVITYGLLVTSVERAERAD